MLATESNVEVRHEFLQRMTQARSETDKLFELVKSNSLYARPIPERHRIVFYIGHLEEYSIPTLTAYSHSASIPLAAVCPRISPAIGQLFLKCRNT